MLDDPITELKELKETEGIAEYHAKFELIRARLKMSVEYLLSAYLVGLRLDTQMHVRMFHPTSTRECLVLGRLYEKAHPKKEVRNIWNQAKPQYNQQKGVIAVRREEGVRVKKNFLSKRK